MGLQPLKGRQAEHRACECVLWACHVIDESGARNWFRVRTETEMRSAALALMPQAALVAERLQKQNSTLGVPAVCRPRHLEAVKGPGMKHGTAIHVVVAEYALVGSGQGVVASEAAVSGEHRPAGKRRRWRSAEERPLRRPLRRRPFSFTLF